MDPEKPFVLVVEDDQVSADALCLVLEDWGARVAHARDSDQVDDVWGGGEERPQFLITDVNLGAGPDGIEVANRLLTERPDLRVLVISGSFHGRAQAAAKTAGFPLLQKPARVHDILAWLDSH